MALVEMVMPKMGESIMEGTVLSWLKQVGDTIEQDESVLEVATDKVDTEVPATHSGVLKEILAQEGEVVPVGKPIAIISTDGADSPSTSAPQQEEKQAEKAMEAVDSAKETVSAGTSVPETIAGSRFYSPLVLNIARQEGISMSDLEQLPGSGKEGRVTKKDILKYVKDGKPSLQQAGAPSQSGSSTQPSTTSQGLYDKQQADRPAQQPEAAKPGVSYSRQCGHH